MIINKTRTYHLDGYNKRKEHREDPFLWPTLDTVPQKYLLIDFKDAAAFEVFPLEELITTEEMFLLKSGEVILALHNSHEAFHHVILPIYNNIVIKYGIKPENVELLSESADIGTSIASVASSLNLGKLRAKWVRRFEFDVQWNKTYMEAEPNGKLTTLVDKPYSKKFLNFNRRWRIHRPILVALLHDRNLLEHGYVSMAKSDDGRSWESTLAMIQKYNAIELFNNQIYAPVMKHADELMGFADLHLDSSNLVDNKAMLTAETNYLYENTYFSVVTETNFFTNLAFESGRFLSEKTFKPVAQQHPFIIVSVPNFLDKFREIGYKSFSPWIDESYDKVIDDSERMLMIVNEIKRLSLLDPHQLTLFLNGVRDICKFNYELFMSKKQYVSEVIP